MFFLVIILGQAPHVRRVTFAVILFGQVLSVITNGHGGGGSCPVILAVIHHTILVVIACSAKRKNESSMILSARSTVTPIANIISTCKFVLFCKILKSRYVQKTRLKIIITIGRDWLCGSAEWINKTKKLHYAPMA